MIFNSVTFVVFLLCTVSLYWVLPQRPRLWMLFLASLTFYGFWRIDMISLMLVSAATDYFASLSIARTRDPRRRRAFLLLSLAVNLGLLFVFKYAGFAADNLATVAALFGSGWQPNLEIVLPLGISFYTFQTISYTVDVYRGQREPEQDFLLYGCYVTFFPQLVAGPILRASELLDQLASRPRFEPADLVEGLRRILFGLVLKVGLADTIAGSVEDGFGQDVAQLHALDVWTLAFLFGFQIYFDFAGYSHIAIGSARLMGIRLPENFNFPYMATSPREFWQRWHISLSSWIRDYLYVPLSKAFHQGVQLPEHAGSAGGLAIEVGSSRSDVRPLLLTWAIMGAWHGAAWTFVVWGVYHGVIVLVHRAVRGTKLVPDSRMGRLLGWAITLATLMLGWIPFRAPDLRSALVMWSRVLDPRQYLVLGLRENTYLIAFLVFVAVTVAGLVSSRLSRLTARPVLWFPVQSVAYTVVLWVVIVMLRPIQQFIYFQF